MKRDRWLVTKEDARPAGNTGECFYCREAIGGQHRQVCVVRKRTVVVRMTVEYVVAEPESWTPDQIEFHRNESSWCANNAIGELRAISEQMPGCLCSHVGFSYVREATADDEESFGLRIAEASI